MCSARFYVAQEMFGGGVGFVDVVAEGEFGRVQTFWRRTSRQRIQRQRRPRFFISACTSWRRLAFLPDTKDWTWVLSEPCPECGFDADRVRPRPDLPAADPGQRDGLGRCCSSPPTPRVRPAPDAGRPWSTPATSATSTGSSPSALQLMLDEDDPPSRTGTRTRPRWRRGTASRTRPRSAPSWSRRPARAAATTTVRDEIMAAAAAPPATAARSPSRPSAATTSTTWSTTSTTWAQEPAR